MAPHMLLLWSIHLFIMKTLALSIDVECTFLITKPQQKMCWCTPLSLSYLIQIEELQSFSRQDYMQDVGFSLLYPYCVWHTLRNALFFIKDTMVQGANIWP
jgi:hypothetical protein